MTASAQPHAKEAAVRNWEARLAALVGGSPVRLAFVVVTTLLGLHFGAQALLGWPTLGDETTAGPISDATRSAVIGAGIVLALALSSPGMRAEYLLNPAAWRTPWLGTWVLSPLLSAIVLRGLCFMAFGSRDARAAIRTDVPVDLLNLRPLAAVGRIALRGSVVWVVGLSIALLFFAGGTVSPGLAAFILGVVCVAIAALVLPVLGLRSRIRAARSEAIAETDASLRSLRDRERAGGAPAPGRLADLLAYRSYLDGLSDWPWDSRTRSRFLLYALIPLGSWIGGALVERAVGSLLEKRPVRRPDAARPVLPTACVAGRTHPRTSRDPENPSQPAKFV